MPKHTFGLTKPRMNWDRKQLGIHTIRPYKLEMEIIPKYIIIETVKI